MVIWNMRLINRSGLTNFRNLGLIGTEKIVKKKIAAFVSSHYKADTLVLLPTELAAK